MKRDVDLARQLLLDIEGRGADCSVSVLRSGPNHEAEERIRYHLRLLIDAGLLKEVDRAANGVPCVRLTDAGHELIELSRTEERWQQAKLDCHERIGGLSLIAIRAILVHWAVSGAPLRRPRRRAVRSLIADDRPRRSSAYRIDPYQYDDFGPYVGEVRYRRLHPEYRNGASRYGSAYVGVEAPRDADDAFLPDYLI